ncbi:MAG: replicative DNA helicase [Candidatus Pacebacteria bacterium]|nr:replicative DNA helicase [Candidatus Paceibacterota bacterium]
MTSKTTTNPEFKTTDKLPPQNIEAEQSVLGSLMIDKNAIIKIADLVNEDDFYKNSHGKIYKTMLYLYEHHEPIDLLSLSNRLKETDEIEQIGGKSYLASLANAVPTAANIVHYAKIVAKKSVLRKLIDNASQIISSAYNETGEIDKTLDEAEQKIFSVSQKHIRQDFTPVKPILEEAFDRIDELHKNKGKLRGVPTGFADLDNILAGLQKSNLIILGARPSVGKSSLGLDLVRHAATKEKIPVGIFSLEMSKEEVIDRLICAEANIDLWKLRTGRLSDSGENDDFSKIGHAMGVLSEAPIFVDDTANINVMEMRTMARRLQAEHGLKMLVIDYLQLMEGRGKTDNRVQEVSEISRSLKGLARELNIPIVALSQLSRGIESRTDQRPKLSDLRESGSIEQDADVVLFIYREDKTKTDSENKNIAEIMIAKHRNGPIGSVKLYFNEQTTSFKNLDKNR